ncbi:hypothetical protein [Microbacterium sp. E-13]|uniref:hypothetical protein n=1 Tax=Microbacterium sp. E-13 TaxID=3404048 RepID=UPI003CF8FBCC
MPPIYATYTRSRWVVPFALAMLSLLISVVALVVVAASFTEENAPLVRVALFGVVPALGLLAVVAAMTASHKVDRIPWGAAMIGLAALMTACVGDLTWYQQLDAADGFPPTSLWILLVSAAVALAAVAIAWILIPSLSRSRTLKRFAVVLGAVAGMVGGVVIVGFLSLPFAGLLVSIAALATVIVLERGDHQTTAPTRRGVAA